MAKKNTNLHNAKSAKNDEFYTRLTDIEKEMAHYKDFFKGKVVYCNCDDARESNFFKYFSLNFEHLGLKKLICTAYKADGKGVVLTYEGDKNGNFVVDDEEVEVRELNGNGDFRSEECIEFLKECDVVVTNPPFSLMEEFVKQLFDYKKDFLFISNLNHIGWKPIFNHINKGEMWLGMTTLKNFINTDKNVPCRWFTNIKNEKCGEIIDFCAKYSDEYYHYGNYDAIDVPKIGLIPSDYDGIMGVPINIFDTISTEQFEIIGVNTDNALLKSIGVKPIGQEMIDLMHSQGKKTHITKNSTELYYIDKNGIFTKPYERVLVRVRKKSK